MNETIGVKGGKNDRKRTLKITKKNKEKLEQYYANIQKEKLKKIENKVKNQQLITFFKVLPIVTIGQIVTSITEKTKEQKEIENLLELKEHIQTSALFSEKITKEIIKVIQLRLIQLELAQKHPELRNNQLSDKICLQIGDQEILEIDLLDKNNLQTYPLKELPKDQEKNLITEEELTLLDSMDEEEIRNKISISKDRIQITNNKAIENITNKLSIQNKENEKNKVEVKEEVQNSIPIISAGLQSAPYEEKLARLKSHKIVDEYDKKLKEIRRELRSLIFEYNTLSEESNNIYTSKEAEQLLERLNTIIKKIEELKRKLELPNIDKYDDNYLYTLVEEYIEEFKNKKIVDEIKDSSLYISISEKLEELDTKKDFLSEKIEEKKETLELSEEDFDKLKDKYFNYEKFNNELIKFQHEQDLILKDINQKLANAVSTRERVEVSIQGMERQNRRLLQLLAAQMMLPGARSAIGVATAAMTSLYFVRNIMNPRTTTRRYATIHVEDYSAQIETTISQLDDVSELLKKTSKQIDIIIKDFKKEYKDYLDAIPECSKLLADLEKIKDSIEEKEYELAKIKDEQELNLQRNNAKVLQLSNDR